jgi:hypothetical protein
MKTLKLVSAGIAFGLSPMAIRDSSPASIAIVVLQGEPGNGRCCRQGAGSLCDTTNPEGGCGYNPVWNCKCLNSGSSCWVVGVAPTHNDLCEIMPPPVPVFANCDTTTTWCWVKWSGGSCDDDGGPWSWGGMCDTCGCKGYDPEAPQIVGSKVVCVSGSTSC